MANGRNGKKRDWLTLYQDYTAAQESPGMFHLWVGISVIASTLSRNCYIDRGYYTLFPNLFIVLVGASARVRKTTAVNVGFNLFKEANKEACVISQKVTPEALIQTLGKRGQERGTSDAVMVSTELSVFLGSSLRDDSLIQLLTKLYDCEETLDYHTIIRGKETIPNVCFNLIGATTPEWIKTSMPVHAVGGGFTSRIIFVYQFKSERKIPFPTLTPAQRALRGELVHKLEDMSKLTGEFHLTPNARAWYEDWYCEVFEPERSEPSLDGYYGRKHDSLLKLAMVFSASRGGSMLVDEVDLMQSLRAMNENEKYLPEVMRDIQSTVVGEERGKVLRAISRKKEVDYQDLLRSLSYCINAQKLNEILGGLVEEGAVSERVENDKRKFKARRR